MDGKEKGRKFIYFFGKGNWMEIERNLKVLPVWKGNGKTMGMKYIRYSFSVEMGGKLGLFPSLYRDREFLLISVNLEGP